MTIPAWLERAFFAPASPLGMVAMRVVLGGQALWILLSWHSISDLAAWPDPFWPRNPATALRYGILRQEPFRALEPFLYYVLIAALLAVVVGVWSRLAALVSTLLLYHFAPFTGVMTYVFDLVGLSGLTLPCLGLAVLATAPEARIGAEWTPDYRWPLTMTQLMLAFHYLGGGLAKAHWTGIFWYTPENVSNLAAVMWAFNSPSLSLSVFESRFLGGAIGAATFLLEFLFPLAVFSKRARLILVPAAVVACVLRYQIFGIFFLGFPSLLLFIDWDWLDRKATRHRAFSVFARRPRADAAVV